MSMNPHEGQLVALCRRPLIFFGTSDVDSFISLSRVQESAAIFQQRGALVTERIYPGRENIVNGGEIAFARTLLQQVSGSSTDSQGETING